MIEARSLRHDTPGGATLLKDITLSVEPGERIGILGPSGAGKTTLGYHLCGVHPIALGGISGGSLLLNGRECVRDGARGFGGLVMQNPESQIFCRTVEEEIALGMPRGTGPEARTRLLERTGLLAHKNADVSTLSLGWKQRLSIAGMLAMEPRALLLDEPTNFLDAGGAQGLFAFLEELKGTAVMIVDHDEARLKGWADRMIRMEKGTVVLDAAPSEWRCGAPLAHRVPAAPPGAVLLRMEGVGFAYDGGRPLLQDFSLSLREGEILALQGPNGAGKSTLLRLAKGLARPRSGTVRATSGRPLMAEVGLVFQNPDEGIFAATVEGECAFLPLNLGVDPAAARARALEVLRVLGLEGLAHRAPFTLSYGEKRRLGLAAVLTGGARILCLDEPTVGLDRPNLDILADLLRAFADAGGAVLFATHDGDFAEALAQGTVRLGDPAP